MDGDAAYMRETTNANKTLVSKHPREGGSHKINADERSILKWTLGG
jgi:hypothetical protein